MDERKQVEIGKLFTEEELCKAITLFCTTPPHLFAARCDAEVVAPVLQRINNVTGQQNSSRYLAYVLQALFTQK